ncbi:RsmE family RNA methyltransferase, partial [Klebsiella pneumoniae]|uniref:RsmE family RNA methyltransferase n=1 Tax=Klebsiella pneumoniae TaxID=573 RepID=UPI002730F00E
MLDGLGGVCRCRVDVLGKKGGTARILERWQEMETAFPVYLLQGLPKGDKLDLVLQKGTELGIRSFTPVISERSVPVRGADRED